ILSNLISNALDAVVGQSGPWIRVSAGPVASGWGKAGSAPAGFVLEIAVEDNGPGLAKEVRDRLFEPHVTTKAKFNGMGLGLSFCQRLVSRNGGHIGFDAEAAQTRFFFSLPLAQGQHTTRREEQAQVA
ncbi:MAG: hypothetical protein RIR26_2632, partial [Pseudomonadota bacterium]